MAFVMNKLASTLFFIYIGNKGQRMFLILMSLWPLFLSFLVSVLAIQFYLNSKDAIQLVSTES